MQSKPNSSNTSNDVATRFHYSQNVSRNYELTHLVRKA